MLRSDQASVRERLDFRPLRQLRLAFQRGLDPHEPLVPDSLTDHPGERRD